MLNKVVKAIYRIINSLNSGGTYDPVTSGSITKTAKATTTSKTDQFGNVLYYHYYNTSTSFSLTLPSALKYIQFTVSSYSAANGKKEYAWYIPNSLFIDAWDGASEPKEVVYNSTNKYIVSYKNGAHNSLISLASGTSNAEYWYINVSSNLKSITFTAKGDTKHTTTFGSTYTAPTLTMVFYY